MFKRLILQTTAALLFLALASCSGKTTLRPDTVFPKIQGPVTVQMLKDRVLFSGIKSIKSEVSINITRDGQSEGRYKGVFVYSSDGRSTIRLFGPMGLTQMDMLLLNNRIEVFVPAKDLLYTGEFPASLSPAAPGDKLLYSMEEIGRTYVLSMFEENSAELELKRKYVFDQNTLLNTQVIIYKDGKQIIECTNKYESDSTLPASIEIAFLNGFSMKMKFIDPSLDKPVAERFFKPKSREGKTVRPVGEMFKGKKKG